MELKAAVCLRGRVIAQHVSAGSLVPRTKKLRKNTPPPKKHEKPRKNQRNARTIKGSQSQIPFGQTTVHVCTSMTYLQDEWEDMGEAFTEEDGSYSQRALVGIH